MKRIIHYLLGHEWQERGINGFFNTTYRKCLRCGETQKMVSNNLEKCDPIHKLDSQFDENNNFISD